MNILVMLLGGLVPILTASLYYVGNQRAARREHREISWTSADDPAATTRR
jgi:hypothetical protein